MVTTVLRILFFASFLLWAPATLAEEVCAPQARRTGLMGVLDEYRHRTWDAELADIPEASRAMVRDRARAVFENPWSVPETSLWRRLFFNQHRANPLPFDQLMVPTQGTVSDTLRGILRDLPRRETELRARIRSHLDRREISYQAYIEACVDSVGAFIGRRGGRFFTLTWPQARAKILKSFLNAEADGSFVIPTYRQLEMRDFPPGGGARLIQLVSRATRADGVRYNPVDFVLHDLGHATQMSNAFLGMLHTADPAILLERQREANRIVRSIEEMQRTDPRGASFMELLVFHRFHEQGDELFFRERLDRSFNYRRETAKAVDRFTSSRFGRASPEAIAQCKGIVQRWAEVYERMFGTGALNQAH